MRRSIISKKVRISLTRMKSLIEGHYRGDLKDEIEEFTLFYNHCTNFVTMSDFILRRQSLFLLFTEILNLSLAHRAPQQIIYEILDIDKIGLSSFLVSVPYFRGNYKMSLFSCHQPQTITSPLDEVLKDGATLFPIEIACKLHLSGDVIILLLQHGKSKISQQKYYIDRHSKINLLHHAVISALCRYRNQNNEPMTLDCIDEWIKNPFDSSYKTIDEEKVEEEEVKPLYKSSFTVSLPEYETFEEYCRLIKVLCRLCPSLIDRQDANGYSPLNIVRRIRAKTTKMEKEADMPLRPDDKIYCNRVDCVYSILKNYRQQNTKAVIDFDLRSEYAQCGKSTGWTLRELFDDSLYDKLSESKAFVHQPAKEFI